MLFELGNIYCTVGASTIPMEELGEALYRHHHGDWGDVDAEDKESNNWALLNRTRLLSSYKSKAGVKFWVITEADRSATTFLLPDEY